MTMRPRSARYSSMTRSTQASLKPLGLIICVATNSVCAETEKGRSVMRKHGRTVKGRSGWYFGGHGARRPVLIATAFLSAAVFVLVACSAPENQNSGQSNAGPASATDWKAVEQALGKAGAIQPGDVYKVSL